MASFIAFLILWFLAVSFVISAKIYKRSDSYQQKLKIESEKVREDAPSSSTAHKVQEEVLHSPVAEKSPNPVISSPKRKPAVKADFRLDRIN